MPEPGDKRVSCSFLRRQRGGDEIVQVEMDTHTGSSPWRMRLRSSAQCYAHENDLAMWAMPCLVHNSADWLVYEHHPNIDPGVALFVARLPTRDAAEMWMLHA